MRLRTYDAATDREAVHRIFREIGWFDTTKEQEEGVDHHLSCAKVMVGELDGAVECVVLTVPSTVRYLDDDLPMCAVTDAATSHVARRQGLAARLTALSIARAAAEGALVAGLGMFDQGFYNQLGFGTGTYEHRVAFDPAQLRVAIPSRPAHRLSRADWEAIHAARLLRVRGHGAVNLTPAEMSRAEMLSTRNPVGLGYHDGPQGSLSHYVWCGAANLERGPYHVRWLAYRTREQFLELMALLKSLGDQLQLVVLTEPPGIQMQDLLDRPFRQEQITEHSPYAAGVRARAWWQMRILDLPRCVAHSHLPAGALRFNLRLSDPIEAYLEPDVPWRGVAGDYVLELGPASDAVPGVDPALPTLTATVNAFTRLWLGVGSARGLAITDELSGPEELLARIDDLLRLPKPMTDWEF